MKRKVIVWNVLLGLLLMLQIGAKAEENLLLFNRSVKDNMLYAYVKNPGEYTEVRCQIGQDYAANVSVRELENPDIRINTYILFDNSLSIQEKYRPIMKEVAEDIISAGRNNESFTIATFDTEIHYLTENSSDTEALRQTVEEIQFYNLDTQITNILYQLYEKIEDENEGGIKRIILMSDGVETKSIGYTKEELIEKVREDTYPIYTLGCTYKSNEEELENMFRISRETNAEYYFLDEIENAGQVAEGIAASFDMVQVCAEIPENQQDGVSKGIKIVFSTDNDEKTVFFNQTMPLLTTEMTEEERQSGGNMTEEYEGHTGTEPASENMQDEEIEQGSENVQDEETAQGSENVQEEETVQGSENVQEEESAQGFENVQEEESAQGSENVQVEETVRESESVQIEETVQTSEKSTVRNIGFFVGVGAGILILAILLILLAIKLRRRKEKQWAVQNIEPKNEDKTEILSGDVTEILDEDSEDLDVINIRLTDLKRPSVVIEYSLETSVTIGRLPEKNPIVFDYEQSVSGQQCEISRHGNKTYIRDLNSGNGTYLDGRPVTEKIELKDGGIIKMGRLRVKFQKIEPVKADNAGSGEKKGTGTEYMFDL